MKRKKPKIELRYYYMPAGSPILPLLGERWVQNYGTGIEDLHFHNFMEIGFLLLWRGNPYSGRGEKEVYRAAVYCDPGTVSSYNKQHGKYGL